MRKIVVCLLHFLLISILISVVGCNRLHERGWLPDYTKDYKKRAKNIPPLVFPPGVKPIIKKSYYPIPKVPNQDSQHPISLLPPGG